IENHIHVEVQKIYPDSQLPTFDLEERTEDSMTMVYKSDKALYMLGKGLMMETFKLFEVEAEVSLQKLNDAGTEVRFFINKKD
ncbi:MAG: heme NO-binding domain-containing protein, partial [Psychroserpens sp.]|nr:heme NO-binding domain-containing protein [Psychroserpens sp.]